MQLSVDSLRLRPICLASAQKRWRRQPSAFRPILAGFCICLLRRARLPWARKGPRPVFCWSCIKERLFCLLSLRRVSLVIRHGLICGSAVLYPRSKPERRNRAICLLKNDVSNRVAEWGRTSLCWRLPPPPLLWVFWVFLFFFLWGSSLHRSFVMVFEMKKFKTGASLFL